MVLLPMTLPIRLPVPIDPHGPQVKPRLGAGFGPAHSRLFHAVLHQVPTGSFHPPRPDRQAARQVVVVVHVRPVALVVAHRPPDRLPLRPRTRVVLHLGLPRHDDGVGLARHQRLQVRADPRQALRMGLPQQGLGRVPQILGGMNDVQAPGVRWKVGYQLLLQRLSAIGVAPPAARSGAPRAEPPAAPAGAWRPLSPPGWPAVLC